MRPSSSQHRHLTTKPHKHNKERALQTPNPDLHTTKPSRKYHIRQRYPIIHTHSQIRNPNITNHRTPPTKKAATMVNPPKIPLSTTSSTSTNPQHARDLQDQITLALLANGGIARIQTALRQRLDEAGWSENLREYVTQLFRSGECSTYFEAMEKVKSRVRLEGRDEDENAGVDGGADLVVPVAAAEGGVEAVRRELEGVCEMRRKEG